MTSAAKALLDEPNHPDVEAAYAQAPATMVVEIARGRLLMGPRPTPPHGRAAKRLGIVLGAPFDLGVGGPGGWVFMDEPELHLGARPDKLQPDMAGWRRSRLPRAPRSAAIGVAPDWVCEVLSPSTDLLDRDVKMPLYAEHGVEHVWLVDPRTETLEVFVRAGLAYQPLGQWQGAAVVQAAPFESLALDLALIWQW